MINFLTLFAGLRRFPSDCKIKYKHVESEFQCCSRIPIFFLSCTYIVLPILCFYILPIVKHHFQTINITTQERISSALDY